MVCGIVFDLEVTSKTKIRRIKEKIHKLRKIPPWDQALMFGAVILRDDLTLRDYGTPERLDLIIFSDAVFPPKATISGSPSIKLASNTSSIDM